MRLESCRLRNIGPFRDFSVDFSAYEGATLIAITGDNGAGKSTFLEAAIPGALYRETPTRGYLTALATSRESSVESVLTSDRTLTIRHLVDGVSGKSEAVILDGGKAVLDSSKVRDFDAFVARRLIAPEVLFSSVFGVQGAEGFVGMKSSDRKAVLLRALGLEHLEAMAAEAREKARTVKASLDTERAKLAEAERGGICVDEAIADVATAEAAFENAKSEDAKAAAALEGARLEAADYTLEARRYNLETVRRGAIAARLGQAKEELAALISRRAVAEHNLSKADEVISAAEALPLERAKLEALRVEARKVEGEIALWRTDEHSANSKVSETERALGSVRTQKAALAGVREAASGLQAARERSADAVAKVAEAELELRELQESSLLGAEDRITLLRRGLEAIRDTSDSSIAGPTIERDDVSVQKATERPLLLDAAKKNVSAARAQASEISKATSAFEASASKLDILEKLESEESRLVAELALAKSALVVVKDRRPVDFDLEPLTTQGRVVEKLEALALNAAGVAAARATLEQIAERVSPLEATISELTAEIEALAPLDKPESVPEIAALEAVSKLTRATLDVAAEALGARKLRLATVRENRERAVAIEDRVRIIEAELADWTRLAADLGRDGIQAAEIDAAGPELTVLVNDLLHTCVGPRWTVTIETTRLSADGKRQIEGCEVRVLDTEKGREAEAATFSGGERVLIGEAVSLALSMLACRRSGFTGATLVRDESGAALSQRNLRVYVSMLRRAAKLVQARHVLFVCHSPAAVELADAEIEVVSDNSKQVAA